MDGAANLESKKVVGDQGASVQGVVEKAKKNPTGAMKIGVGGVAEIAAISLGIERCAISLAFPMRQRQAADTRATSCKS